MTQSVTVAVSILSVTLMIAGCVSNVSIPSSNDNTVTTEAPDMDLEPVDNARVQGDTIAFTAITTGCTSNASFLIKAEAIENQCHVRVVRQIPDYCKAAPRKASFQVEWSPPQGCAGLPIIVDNPPIEVL